MAFWLSVPGSLRLSLSSEPRLRAPMASADEDDEPDGEHDPAMAARTARPRRYSPPVTANSSRRSGKPRTWPLAARRALAVRATLQRPNAPVVSCWTTARRRVYGLPPCPFVLAPSPRQSSPRPIAAAAPAVAGATAPGWSTPHTASATTDGSYAAGANGQGVQLFGTGGAPTRTAQMRAIKQDATQGTAVGVNSGAPGFDLEDVSINDTGQLDRRVVDRHGGHLDQRQHRRRARRAHVAAAHRDRAALGRAHRRGADRRRHERERRRRRDPVDARRSERAGRDAADRPGPDHRAAHRATRRRSRS